MPEGLPSVLSHVSVGTAMYEKALAFYDPVMATLGAKRIMEVPEAKAVAYGRQFPEFWVQVPDNDQKPSVGNGYHVAFLAASKQSVDDFFSAAIEAGGSPDGEPGPRPHYGEAYYGCFVRDLDGHKIEAMYWNQSPAES